MHRTPRLATTAAIAAALTLAAPAVAGSAATTQLAGTVGPSFTIKLTKGGKPVKTLAPGKYTIKVADKSSSHNFHLLGLGGLSKEITTVPFTGSKSVTVTLKKGTYTFQCDPHASMGMKGTFKVS